MSVSHIAAGFAALLILGAQDASATVTIDGPETMIAGSRLGLKVTGLAPRTEATVETFRTAPVFVNKAGQWSTEHPLFHALARYWADDRGEIDLAKASPLAGTYSGADPKGLLWSGAVVGRAPEPAAPADAPGLEALKDGEVRVLVRTGGQIVATRGLQIKPWADGVTFTTVDTPRLVGVFAAPANADRAPTVIILHGSEGGDFKSAKAEAGLYASQGFAAFALIYFTWPYAHIANTPSGFSALPVERIAYARDWLRTRPETDIERLGIKGGSKGAEFGLLAASVYPWIRAVAACVPSAIVWGGFGAPAGAHGESFSLDGRPVPYVPYGDYGPVERHEITSAQRHQRDWTAASPDLLEKATIRVERSRAKILLISGGRDAVWPSDAMSARIVERMRAFGQAKRVEWRSFPDAGHYLCGTGASPIRYNEGDETMLGGGLLSADGRDPGKAWDASIAFLKTALSSSPSPSDSPSP